MDFGYTYNPVGSILSVLDKENTAQTRTFTYDAIQQLRTGGTTNIPETYDYDLTGNRTTSFLSTLQIHDDGNRLVEDDDFTYTYDANGNLGTKTETEKKKKKGSSCLLYNIASAMVPHAETSPYRV